MDYAHSEEVTKVARHMIERDDDHAHLQGMDFFCFFMAEHPRPGKEESFDPRDVLLTKHKWAEVKLKKSPADVATREAMTGVAEPWFTLAVNQIVWNFLKSRQRRALVDEYLRRCDVDRERGVPVLKKPDVVAFVRNVEKYGTWYHEIEELAKVTQRDPEGSGEV